MSELTEQQFLRDVANHSMEIIRDDGLYRHIRFREPGTMMQHFDLLTWPGCLCYTGDMGTYVFERTKDMFQFFRSGTSASMSERHPGRTLFPNFGYWAEKLQATDSNGKHSNGATEFDEERFEQVVLEDVKQWARDHRDCTTKEERRDLYDAVVSEVIGADGDSGGYRKQTAAYDFRHHVNTEVRDFEFQDFFEHNVDKWTHRFEWCCFALAWGVAKYDAAKAEQPQPVEA